MPLGHLLDRGFVESCRIFIIPGEEMTVGKLHAQQEPLLGALRLVPDPGEERSRRAILRRLNRQGDAGQQT